MKKPPMDPPPKKRKQLTEIAYVITDPRFGDLPVRRSDNAWWMDRKKVEFFIQGKKLAFNDKDACIFAMITWGQLNYFLKENPIFFDYFQTCALQPRALARANLAKNLEDPKNAIALLKYTDPDFKLKISTEAPAKDAAEDLSKLTLEEIETKLQAKLERIRKLKQDA